MLKKDGVEGKGVCKKKRGLTISEVDSENGNILAFQTLKVGNSSVTKAIKEID